MAYYPCMAPTPQRMDDRKAVAREIRALMGRHVTSQTALAAALGMSQPSLSNRLRGKKAFEFDELLAIADYFDVEVTALFAGIGQGESSLPWTTTLPGQLSLLEPAA